MRDETVAALNILKKGGKNESGDVEETPSAVINGLEVMCALSSVFLQEAVSAATDEERLVKIHNVIQQLPPPHYRSAFKLAAAAPWWSEVEMGFCKQHVGPC